MRQYTRTATRLPLHPHEYDLQWFLAFMLKAVDAALDSIGLYKQRVDLIRGLSAPATEVLQCFKQLPEQRLTPSSIRQQTQIAERTVSHILKSLVEAGLIQRYGRGAGTRYQLVF